MACFEEVELYVDKDGDYVNFLVKPHINFEGYEKCIMWSLTIKFFEHDILSSDDFIHEVIHIIDPEKHEEFEEFKERIKKEEIEKHANLAAAKVYVDLKLKPLQTLAPTFIRSNYEVIHLD